MKNAENSEIIYEFKIVHTEVNSEYYTTTINITVTPNMISNNLLFRINSPFFHWEDLESYISISVA